MNDVHDKELRQFAAEIAAAETDRSDDNGYWQEPLLQRTHR